ncbi:hypothetical protein GCM10022212_28020 [Actimicrobium antarcticum]|uniref:Uncharacterized protein n=1 Tax=Actimicrobium antarcticum TaxID=1051899 RepID=A0ABP7TM19_9BURK
MVISRLEPVGSMSNSVISGAAFDRKFALLNAVTFIASGIFGLFDKCHSLIFLGLYRAYQIGYLLVFVVR